MMSSKIKSFKHLYALSPSVKRTHPKTLLLPKLLFVFCKKVTDFATFVIFKYILNYLSEIKMYR